MLASLEEAYRAQQRFVADAAHELRAPLTAIQGNIELLARVPDMPSDDRSEAMSYLDREAARLARLVNELLTLARADAGQTVERRPVELDEVVLEAVAEMRAVSHGERLAVDAAEPVAVSGDSSRLKQLVLILLDNALRYTPDDGAIRVRLARAGGDGVLEVADNGMGIPEDALPHIFERFYRADPARGRDPGGSGLGLAIARWIVEQHEGQIAAESTEGQGTVITVRLPLLPAPEPQAGALPGAGVPTSN
jgi:signal transduction histidine kinase